MSSNTGTMSASIGMPVELNVYDLLHPENPDAVPNMNWYLYGFGVGLYHSGVSIYGTEYCYGGHPDAHTGVFEVAPRKAPDAKFRQTVLVGRTSLTPPQVSELVQAMMRVWTGNTYNLLTRCVPTLLYRYRSAFSFVSHRANSNPLSSSFGDTETVTTSPLISVSVSRATPRPNG